MREEGITFGALLRRHRLRAGLTHEALAERAEVSAAAIAALERGRRHHPYPHTVSRLAEALDLSSEERAAFGALASARGAHAILPPPGIPPKAPASNFPAPRTRLIGRERDIATLVELVPVHPGRLVTLTGVGGSGKTRLALRVAEELVEAFPDGVWLVDLSPTADPALVAAAVAKTLGVPEAPGVPLIDTLTTRLRTQTLLIVLDNCEHVLDGCAQVVEPLLTACPGARILATSREPLQLAGERQWRVHPLAVPDLDQHASFEELAGFPALQLVEDRAQAVDASFRLTTENAVTVAKICARLDGIPLALELAAAWARVLSVGQILERLDDSLRLLTGGSRVAPTRLQTLRATLDWSHDLLTEPERAMFRRLAVFASGCDLAAAQAVCWEGQQRTGTRQLGVDDAADISADVLDMLTRLVDKSLVLVEQGAGAVRYRLLEPVRQYAEQHLRACGETEAVRERHAACYLTLAEQVAPELRGPNQVAWLHRLEREHDNLRAALRWTQGRGDAHAALRLGVALVPFWDGRGYLGEGRRWLRAALDGSQTSCVPIRVRTRALLGEGSLAEVQGDLDVAEALLEQCLALARTDDDLPCVAWSIAWLGLLHGSRGDVARAATLFEDSLQLFRALEDPPGIAFALLGLGMAAGFQGDATRACLLLEESVQRFRALGDTRYIAVAQTMLGFSLTYLGDVAGAAAVVAEGLAGHWLVGDRTYLAYGLVVMAGVLYRLRELERAVRLLGAAEVLREFLGGPLASSLAQVERLVAALRRHLAEAVFETAWAAGRAMTLDESVAEALAVARPSDPSNSGGEAFPAETLPEPLTRREQDVARLLARGYSDRQIADALTIALSTVGTHVHHLLAKLGVHSRWQVADWALERGLVEARPH